MKFFLRNNDSEDDVGKMECEQIKLEKATSPEPSYTSDKSKDRHIQFKGGTQRKRRNKRLRPDEATSPAPSCTSLQSDLSMDRPIVFKDEAENIPIIKSLIPGQATSPAPSCTSLQSDLSMDRPILFKDEAQNIWIIKRWPEKRISTASSSASLQSDQSMDRPIQFKTPSFIKVDSVVKENATELSSLRKEMLSPDISTFSATLLTEDHYRCSVCTEVFKNPVSIPCGHSYCKHCIEIYWSKPTQAECYACPLCRKRFRDRPVLNVNVALAKLIEELQRAGFSPALPDHCYAGPEDVSCDICIDMKLKAVKSCLTCCVSYCETHVRQHYTVPALQRHNLIEPCNISCDTETTEKFSAVTKLQEENKVLTATVKKLTSTLTEKAKRFCKTFEVHFNDFPSDIIEVAALGRPLCLGMLYDTKSDSYSQNSFLWNDRIIASMRVSLPRPQTHVKVLEGDFLQDRFRALELSPVLRTRALQGLLEVNGAAAFLNHPVQSEHHDRVTLHYKTTTRLDMISQTLLQEGVSPSVINTTTATHVIIAVCYGAQAFFVFNSSEKKAEMKDVIKKVSSSFCRSHMDSCLNDSVKAMSMFYNCSLYSDMCDWKSPVSFDKAMEIYGSLPGLLGPKGEKAVPLKVWLYPLKKLKTTSACATLNGVSKNLMLRAENIQEHLNKQIRISQDFMTNPDNLSVIIWFPSLKDKLVEFSDLLQKYQADFQEKITEIAEDTQVKEEEEEMRLQHLLERHDQSPFCAENIYQWLENIETKLKILNDCKAADITVVKSQTELQRELNHPQKTRVMCFTLTSPDAEDSFLTVLKQNNESDHIIPADSLQFKPVKISQKVLIDLQLYIAAKEADEDTEQTKFIAASVPDDVFPEYSVQYYYAGRIVSRNMKFEVKPDLAQIAQIKHNSVSLKFNHFFNKSIAGYVVEYRVVEDDGMNNNTWKQKTINTHTLKEKCVLSCLEPDTEYQLRYAVYDNKSMSDFSWITYFKTSSVARPGQPSVVKLNRNTLRLSWLKADANENCPVLQYMVEYKEAGLEGWSSVLTQGPQCDYTLTVAHSTCYRVRVSAVYEDITSKPSEETSVPVDVWTINLSERKSSILLEVLKLQTEKKPVELIDWTHEESEVRGFIQCLPYISELRNAERYVPLLCKAFGPKVKRDQVTPLLQALGFTVTLRGKLPSSTCTCVGRVLALSPSKINLTLTPQAISLKGVRFIFRHITHLQKLSLEDRMLKKMVRALRSSFGPSPLTTEELELVTKGSKQNHCRIVRRLTSLLKHLSVQYLDLTNCRIDTVFVTALLCLQGLQTIRFSKETLQQLVSVVYEAQDDGLTRCFLEKVSEDLTACTLTWEVIQYLLQHQALDLNVDLRKSQISCTNTRELVPWLSRIKLKRVSSSFILSIIIEIYESRSPQYVSGLLSSAENYINLKSQVLNSDQCAALRFTLQHCNTVRLDLFWTSIPEEELKSILPLLNRVTQLSVDRQLLLKMLHCCSSSDDQQGAAALLLSALHNKLDFSFCSSLDLTDTQENQNHLNLTKKDCRIISSVLQTSQGVVKLVLEDCKISDRALKQLLPILSRVQLRCSKALLLQFLACISKGTRSGSVRRAQALSQALGEELDLSHTHMNQRACEELVLFLKYSDGLTELDLSHCKLTDQYIEPLLPHLHKTQTLDLSHNNITDELAKRIHSVVSTHSNIQTVRLFGNKIRDVKKYKNDTQIEIW